MLVFNHHFMFIFTTKLVLYTNNFKILKIKLKKYKQTWQTYLPVYFFNNNNGRNYARYYKRISENPLVFVGRKLKFSKTKSFDGKDIYFSSNKENLQNKLNGQLHLLDGYEHYGK